MFSSLTHSVCLCKIHLVMILEAQVALVVQVVHHTLFQVVQVAPGGLVGQ